MAKTRKSLARYGPVILVTSAVAHSAFAPLRGRVRAAAVHPSPKSETAADKTSADKEPVNTEITADPIAGFRTGVGDSYYPPLQTRLNNPVIRTPLSALLDPAPASTISLLNTSGLGAPTSTNKSEPPLPAPIAKSEPVNSDPGDDGVSDAPQIPTGLQTIENSPGGPKPIPEPITFIPTIIMTTLLGRPRRSTIL